MNKYWVLVRREYWEHRALWAAPLIVAALILVGSLFGTASFSLPDSVDTDRKRGLFGLISWGLTVPFYITMAIVLLFYLLDSLYAERRDRSILFWKSLPVSDTATVVSKFLVATLIAPLAAWSLGALTSLLSLGILGLRSLGASSNNSVLLWDTGLWLHVQGLILLSVLVAALWYAPIAAYLMVVSAWAKRSVFVWASLPPVLLIVTERYAFGTEHVQTFLRDRIVGFAQLLTGDASGEAGRSIPSVGRLFESFDAVHFLNNPGLWVGVLLAVALLALAVRLRRYRDDT